MTADDRLSVIVINDFASVTGGTAKVALASAAGLARRGHHVTLVAGQGAPGPELLDAGVDIRLTGQPTTLDDPNRARAAMRGIWNRAAAALVRELVAGDSSATIVHVHGFAKILSSSVVGAAVQARLPVVATMHDYSVACPNAGFYNYQRDEICRLTPLSVRCVATHCDARAYSHKLWRVTQSAVQRRLGSVPNGVGDLIAPSHFAADIVRPFLPPASRVHVVPNPISTERQPAVDVSGNAAFAFVGRLAREKGALLFAKAARQAGVPAVFVGAGDQADAIRRALPDAELTGWLDSGQVREVLRRARAVVGASPIYETQGLSVLEAAAEGVPAVVSDVTAGREAVADGVTGLWFRSGDVDDLAAKLATFQADPQLAGRMGRAAYERFWAERWDLPTHVGRLEAIYRAALARSDR